MHPAITTSARAAALAILVLALRAGTTDGRAWAADDRGSPDGSGPVLGSVAEPPPSSPSDDPPDGRSDGPSDSEGLLAPAPRIETWVDVPATVFLPGRADPREWMSTGTWARITYDGFNYDYGYDPLAQTYDMLVSGYADPSGILVQETVGVMAAPLPTTLQSGQVERVECWFLVPEHNLYPNEYVGITALEDEIEPRGDLNSLSARLLYEDARGFRGAAYALDHFDAGAHAIDLGAGAVTDLEAALLGSGWFGVGFAADGWDLSGSLGQQVFWRVAGGGALPENNRPFFRVAYNAPPDPFALLAPEPAATVDVSRPWLRWEAASDPNLDAPLTYRVLLSGSADFAEAVSFEVSGVTEARPPLPLGSGTYHWRVDATDPAGALRTGEPSTFTVAFGVDAPGTPPPLSLRCSPNPFNPRTRILLEIPREGPGTVEILDLRGRRVRELFSGTLRAGSHEFVWNGEDASGRPCATGVYQVRLRTAGEQRVVRISLLR